MRSILLCLVGLWACAETRARGETVELRASVREARRPAASALRFPIPGKQTELPQGFAASATVRPSGAAKTGLLVRRHEGCSTRGWLYAEGKCANLGEPVPLGTLRFGAH